MKSYMIIGAGILGASAAYHLAKAGADVTVIDRKHPGRRLTPRRGSFARGCRSGAIRHGMRSQKAAPVIMND